MDDRIPMTKEGFEKLSGQLEEMKAKRPRISRAIAEARDKGDLKENAEYHAAREEQGLNEARIRELETRLAKAYIVKPSRTGQAQLGSKVTVLDLDEEFEEVFYLVGSGEDDHTENRILTTSPFGAAMLEKKKGDTFEVDAPAGKLRFKILEVE